MDDYTLISDNNIQITSDTSILIDLRLCQDINIKKQQTILAQTKIIVNGPINNFNMLIKKHVSKPDIAILTTEGFVSPLKNRYSDLNVEIYNPLNYTLKLLENDVVGVIVLSPYKFN